MPIEYLVCEFLVLLGSHFLRYFRARNQPGVMKSKVSIPIKKQNPTRKHPKARFCRFFSSGAGHSHPPLDRRLTWPFILMRIEIIVRGTLLTSYTTFKRPPAGTNSKSLSVFNATNTCICCFPGELMLPWFWVCRYIRKLYLLRMLKLLLILHFYIIAKPTYILKLEINLYIKIKTVVYVSLI